jgi:hypothetical protein
VVLGRGDTRTLDHDGPGTGRSADPARGRRKLERNFALVFVHLHEIVCRQLQYGDRDGGSDESSEQRSLVVYGAAGSVASFPFIIVPWRDRGSCRCALTSQRRPSPSRAYLAEEPAPRLVCPHFLIGAVNETRMIGATTVHRFSAKFGMGSPERDLSSPGIAVGLASGSNVSPIIVTEVHP